ncbi:aldehyde dehydrogenase family protein [Rhizobium mongolense]|uniref:Acyl-CoA reductase-like NAD-dependent aldehyde dehydrogenase n=1 Tax=Rhizobium mongolense TaxID=57676 RepID=A0A7W6RLN5_9HYPH|nr:acyl-CoA reductase-like NAD-dependent aldehyde dehydrogenase [Rhizobium mongolense]
MSNNTPFGLASYLYTRDISRAFRVAEALEFGMVGINAGSVLSTATPFEGIKGPVLAARALTTALKNSLS